MFSHNYSIFLGGGENLSIRIKTGKKEELRFKNNKMKIDSGKKSIHTGKISIGADRRNILSENSNNTNTKANSQSLKPSSEKRKQNNLIERSDSLLMKQGQKISLNQKASNLSMLVIGLEWDENYGGNNPLDLDVSIFMVDGNNSTSEENFIFYNNPKSIDGSVHLDGDHSINIKECYDTTIQVNLNRVSNDIQKLAITVTIDEADERNQNFSNISKASFRVIDASKKKEILSYSFHENLNRETAIVVAEIYRYKNDWKINTIGSGFSGGLQALCDNYGIETD